MTDGELKRWARLVVEQKIIDGYSQATRIAEMVVSHQELKKNKKKNPMIREGAMFWGYCVVMHDEDRVDNYKGN